MIITEINKLQIICESVSSITEGEDIAVKLFNELTESNVGIGIAANQIGINKRVFVVNVKEPIYFINPTITNKSDNTFLSMEGCLSFPNKHSLVKRHSEVTIKSDNFPNGIVFSAETENENDMLECACIQHEMDHLDGIVMMDKEIRNMPYQAPEKIGRNEKVTITDGTETKTLKYKKAEPLIVSGKWEIYTPAMIEPGSYGR